MPIYTDSQKIDRMEEENIRRFERLNIMLKRIYTILDCILSLIQQIVKNGVLPDRILS